jgi:signal transduction histidine kinase
MNSIRTRLLIALLILVALVSLVAGWSTYQRVFAETSTLFDYQLRQMALSLRSQVSIAPRIEVPPDQGDTDFVVQIWDPFGTRMYLSRPGLPIINQTVLGYADLSLNGEAWRVYGLQTSDGVIQIGQPVRVREALARRAASRVLIPLGLMLPFMIIAVAWIVRSGLRPLRTVAIEVKHRDAGALTPLRTQHLPTEIEPLVSELNRLLGRLQIAFSAQRAFIADAAHELRSPLTALRLHIQLLDRALDAATRAQARSSLGAAIERAIHLVEQLLALARSDPHEATGELIAVALSEVTAQAVADSHAAAVSRHIELTLETEPDLSIRGDPEALRTLTRNLIDNAVRYTPEGGEVRVVTRSAGGSACLQISDSGPGIAPADRERIFDRFYRRAAASETGTGLGLAIVKAIAERHEASISLDDGPAGGLRVMVRFPAGA